MTNHTPTPWVADNDLGCKAIKGNKGGTHKQAQYTEIAWTVGLANEEKDRANAARIVACVNACAGINPEAVPDLIAALQHGLGAAKKAEQAHDIISHVDAKHGLHNWTNAARAALAKAKLP